MTEVNSCYKNSKKELDLTGKISLLATAVGSLPYNNPNEALDLIFANFSDFPVWPQLAKVNPKETCWLNLIRKFPV